jgi:hypothetical protein
MAISAIIDALDKPYCAITTQNVRPLPEEWTRAWIFSSIGELLGTVAAPKLRFNGVQLFRYLTSEVGVEGLAHRQAAVGAVRQPRVVRPPSQNRARASTGIQDEDALKTIG